MQKSVAKEAREKVIGALYSNKYAVYANVTVQEFYEFWLEKVKKQTLSYNSYSSYKNSIRNYILPLYGFSAMGELGKNHIKRTYQKTYKKYPFMAKCVKGVLTPFWFCFS